MPRNNSEKDTYYLLKKKQIFPGWCGSVDSAPDCEPKGHWFNSPSGHFPVLSSRSPVGGA